MSREQEEELKRKYQKIEYRRNMSATALFFLIPVWVAVHICMPESKLEWVAVISVLVCGVYAALQNVCPNCHRFYLPFRVDKFIRTETAICPWCGLHFRTGKFEDDL